MISRDERLFREQQLVLQRAREMRLTYGALLREIEQKDVLLHTIVHDLAASLHGVLGMLSLLDESKLRDPKAGWVHSALHAARLQKRLIGDVLEVFSAEHDAPAVSLAEAPEVSRIIQQVSVEVEPAAASRNVRFEADSTMPSCHVVAEKRRLVRVITNLLENALGRSPTDGVVRVSVRQEEGRAFVAVEDQGSPVPIDDLPRLFEMLPRSRAVAGSALGLYFCRITVEKWGGGIGYEPSEHGGRFWVQLQAAAGTAPATDVT